VFGRRGYVEIDWWWSPWFLIRIIFCENALTLDAPHNRSPGFIRIIGHYKHDNLAPHPSAPAPFPGAGISQRLVDLFGKVITIRSVDTEASNVDFYRDRIHAPPW
jgi:hypothetical protein